MGHVTVLESVSVVREMQCGDWLMAESYALLLGLDAEPYADHLRTRWRRRRLTPKAKAIAGRRGNGC